MRRPQNFQKVTHFGFKRLKLSASFEFFRFKNDLRGSHKLKKKHTNPLQFQIGSKIIVCQIQSG